MGPWHQQPFHHDLWVVRIAETHLTINISEPSTLWVGPKQILLYLPSSLVVEVEKLFSGPPPNRLHDWRATECLLEFIPTACTECENHRFIYVPANFSVFFFSFMVGYNSLYLHSTFSFFIHWASRPLHFLAIVNNSAAINTLAQR